MLTRFLNALRARNPAALALATAIAGVAALAILAWVSRGPAAGTDRGEGPLPAFTVQRLDGESVPSAALLGQPLVLNLWASWCIPCREETPGIERVFGAYGDRVRFAGINVRDDRDDALAYAADLGITYPILFDVADSAYDALRTSGVPTSLFVAADGTVVRRVVGPMTERELAAYLDELLAR